MLSMVHLNSNATLRHLLNTKKSHSYQPYKLVPDVPQGLINRIKYFHNNDHIILKKYVADKGKMQYELFNVFYNVYFIHHVSFSLLSVAEFVFLET